MTITIKRPSEDECKAKHRGLNWAVGVILIIVSIMAVLIGYDAAASTRALDIANQAKADTAVFRATLDERIRATSEKLDGLQTQIDRRIEGVIKAVDKVGEKVDKIK